MSQLIQAAAGIDANNLVGLVFSSLGGLGGFGAFLLGIVVFKRDRDDEKRRRRQRRKAARRRSSQTLPTPDEDDDDDHEPAEAPDSSNAHADGSDVAGDADGE